MATSSSFNRGPLPSPRLGPSGMLGAGVSVVASSYFRLKEGQGFGTSLLKGLGESALYAAAPTAMFAGRIGYQVVKGATSGIINKNRQMTQDYRMRTRTEPHFNYMDTQAAVTMRQASVQAIQGSKLNARNALGGEAALMHRGHRR